MYKIQNELDNALRHYFSERKLPLEQWHNLYQQCDDEVNNLISSLLDFAELIDAKIYYHDEDDNLREKGIPLESVAAISTLIKSNIHHLQLYRRSKSEIGCIIDSIERGGNNAN